MQRVLFKIFILLFLIFSGCFDNKDIKDENILKKEKILDEEIKKARIKADKDRELALTKMKKELEEIALKKGLKEAELKEKLAQIEAKKELEIEKIDKELKLKELEIEKEKIALEIKAKEKLYIILIIAFIILLIFIGIILYFYKKRKDKIMAYHDNLEKYFRLKENETKVAIANKIIDTIASKKLSPEQEERLLLFLKSSNLDKKSLPKDIDDTIEAKIDESNT